MSVCKVRYRSNGVWSEYCDNISVPTSEPTLLDNGVGFVIVMKIIALAHPV